MHAFDRPSNLLHVIAKTAITRTQKLKKLKINKPEALELFSVIVWILLLGLLLGLLLFITIMKLVQTDSETDE